MNEELIARLMSEQGMTREQAVATLQNTNSVDMQFLNAFAQGSQNQMFSGQPTTISDQLSSNLQYGVPSAPVQQPSVLNNSSQPLFNPSGGINWGMMSGNQNIPNPYQQPQQYNVPGMENIPTNIPQNGEVNLSTTIPVESDMSDEERRAIEANRSMWDQNRMQQNQQALFNQLGYLNPYGTDLETELYTLGRGIGNATSGQGGTANTLGIIGSAGSALLGGARSSLSGYSNSIANNRYWQWMQNRRRQQRYSVNSQTQNTQADALGGITQG